MVVLSCPAIATVKMTLIEIQNEATGVKKEESKVMHMNNEE